MNTILKLCLAAALLLAPIGCAQAPEPEPTPPPLLGCPEGTGERVGFAVAGKDGLAVGVVCFQEKEQADGLAR